MNRRSPRPKALSLEPLKPPSPSALGAYPPSSDGPRYIQLCGLRCSTWDRQSASSRLRSSNVRVSVHVDSLSHAQAAVIHLSVHIYTHTHLQACMHACMYTCMHTYIHTHAHIHGILHTHKSMNKRVYLHVCMCMIQHIYIQRQSIF